MQKAIGMALIGAGLFGVFQLWSQSGGLNKETRQTEQSVSERNGGSNLANWTQPALWVSTEPVTVVVTLPRAKAPSELPLRTTRMSIDRASLTRTLQSELTRVGCYGGQINGEWTPSTRGAMKAFTDYVNAKLPVDKPDGILLSLIQNYEGNACRGSCPSGQGLMDGHCIPDALIAHAKKKPEKVAPLIAQTSSRPTQTAALENDNTDSNPPSVAPQPASSAGHNVRVRSAAGRPPETRRARTFGPSIFSQLVGY